MADNELILELISHGDSAEKDYSITVKFSAIWGNYNLSNDIIDDDHTDRTRCHN